MDTTTIGRIHEDLIRKQGVVEQTANSVIVRWRHYSGVSLLTARTYTPESLILAIETATKKCAEHATQELQTLYGYVGLWQSLT